MQRHIYSLLFLRDDYKNEVKEGEEEQQQQKQKSTC
jgi:hypothetical protein